MTGYTQDEKFMLRCLDLALQGNGLVAPNPMVGAVLVHDRNIIGEGFHHGFGKAHAEVNALEKFNNVELPDRSCLYVNLEPCSHYGKTPPCTDLIIKKKISRIVIGTIDPNILVAGKGKAILQNNGAEVITGILEKECRHINRRFFSWHQKQRPYIILKWARSADGFIDFDRPADAPVGPNWITSLTARTLVHKWRSEEQAILVGTNTVKKDNPMLNVRYWSGNDPLRIIIDRRLSLGKNSHVFDNSRNTVVFTETGWPEKPETTAAVQKQKPTRTITSTVNHETSGKTQDPTSTRYVNINFDQAVELQILDFLYRENIQSVIIEGGAFTLNSFINKNLWDEARIFTGTVLFRKGIRSPEITGTEICSRQTGNSILQVIYNNSGL